MPPRRGLQHGRPPQQPPQVQFLGQRAQNAYPFGMVPPKTVVGAYLTSAEITRYFDATGLGKESLPYEGWAIVNGNNGTPANADGKYLLFETSSGAGTTGGSSTTSNSNSASFEVGAGVGEFALINDHTHTIEPPYIKLVPLMRVDRGVLRSRDLP